MESRAEHMNNSNPGSKDMKSFWTIILLHILIIALHLPVVETIWRHSFDDGTYSHAYLIPLITIFLYFQLAKVGELTFNTKILLLPALGVLGSAIGLLLAINVQFSLGYWFLSYALLISAIALIFKPTWYSLFPATFLIFALPVWGALTTLLQELSIIAVTFIMTFTGIPAYVEGALVSIPSGTFEIAHGCSGLRYFMVSLAISSLYVFMYIRGCKQILTFLSFALLGALLTNWIRITALIIIGHQTEMKSPLMEDHNMFGWYIFLPFMLVMFYLGGKLENFSFAKLSGYETNSIHKPALSLGLFVLLTSSSSILLSHSNYESSTEQLAKVAFKPQLNFPASVEQQKTTILNATHLRYSFNLHDLDSKPSYYQNDLLPQNWRIITDKSSDDHQLMAISNSNKNALLKASYLFNGERYASASAVKRARLKQVLSFPQETQIDWLFVLCKTNCQQESQQLN